MNQQPILSMHMWTALSSEQRSRIRMVFTIPRSSHVEVVDGRILTDGTTAKDFEALTVEKMKDYLKSDSNDFHALFDLVIARVQDEIEGKTFNGEIVYKGDTLTVLIPPNPPKRRGRPANNAKHA